jgi:hypothetical protein
MDSMIAYCGLTCTDCPAYLATQADDRQALERVAAQWREQFNEPRITADAVICDGCLGEGRLSGYCSMCEIRACAVEGGVTTCARCTDYACDKLEAFFQHAPEPRALLDQLAPGLA